MYQKGDTDRHRIEREYSCDQYNLSPDTIAEVKLNYETEVYISVRLDDLESRCCILKKNSSTPRVK